jgi:hypothetical protein
MPFSYDSDCYIVLAMTSGNRQRGRPKKNITKDSGLQILIKSNSKYEVPRVEDDPESIKKKSKRKEFLKNLEKKAATRKTIVLSDDEEDECEDEFAEMRLSLRRQTLRDESDKLIELFNHVGVSASNFVASMDKFLSNGNVDGVKDWLDTCGLDINDERVNSVENLCNTIARILRARRAPKATRTQQPLPGDISIAPCDQFFVSNSSN